MISKAEIRQLLADIENDRVERTISTTNTDKFGQAICAFANDLPNHKQAGYLFLGVNDDGTIHSITVTDELLKNVAAIRTDGNIQPQPSMVVEKVSFPEGDIIVVEVQPLSFPPVRYKGRVWIRVGSRKGIASEADERVLMEKRNSNVQTFDATPCLNATIDDLDLELFEHYYLPKTMPAEELRNDKREVTYQLSALGFYDTRYNCPTNAGVLMFAKNLRHLFPSAYVQYVRFKGKTRAGDIMMEHEFKDNLCVTLQELDTFIKTTIVNRRPIPVSALREESVVDYPDWATRELLMNATCHRDYSSNGPIQFYQYDDRIEIMNHGGLYGRATVDNFPNVNDYRNQIIAEAMKVLGFVNRHSRGVIRVREELERNENGEPIYDFSLGTAVLVTERKSLRGERLIAAAINQGLLKETDIKTDIDDGKTDIGAHKTDIDERKTDITNFHNLLVKNVYELIKRNRKIKYSEMEDNLGVTERTIARAIDVLKEMGLISKEHSKIKGEWQLID